MISFVLLSAPIFGMLLVGWGAMRMRLLTPDALGSLGAFSFRFALPALVFRLIAVQPLGRSFNPLFYGGYLASGGLVFALILGLARIFTGQSVAMAGARATAASVSNLGFLGPPLMLAFFGDRGAGPLAMAILAEVMVLLSLGGAIMGVSRNRSIGVVALALESTVHNPVVIGIAFGAMFAATGHALPGPLDRFFSFLGGAAGPTALFAVGGALASQRIDRATAVAAASITTAKIIVYPMLVWYVLGQVLHLEAFWVQAGVLVAALPSAGNTYVVAQRYGADPDGVSAAIALSTLVSIVTVPFAAWVMLR